MKIILSILLGIFLIYCTKEKSMDPVNPLPWTTLPVESPNPSPSASIEPSPEPSASAVGSPSPSATVVGSPSPSPSPTPLACPCLLRWGIGSQPLNIMNWAHQPVPKIEENGYVVYDTTPRFLRFPGDNRGGPCNGDHDNCNGRQCEDPRGGSFEVLGPSPWNVMSSGYQVKVGPLRRGQHQITVCPRKDLQDFEGEPVSVCNQSACSGTSFDVP